MSTRGSIQWMALTLVLLVVHAACARAEEAPRYSAELIFPLHPKHNHAPSIVECPGGDLLVSWYRGSGERTADDVAIYGSWLPRKKTQWSEPFLMIDTPGFPDGNTVLFIDSRRRLWLFWPIVLANTWESSITTYRTATWYKPGAAPRWEWQGQILLKPENFAAQLEEALQARLKTATVPVAKTNILALMRQRAGDKMFQRLGWQPRCKPTVLKSGRIVLPLYSDTFDLSIMALSDDAGATWLASRPLAGFGNIQPAVLQRTNGTLAAYMRENGPLHRVRVAESQDEGATWGPIEVTELLNPGSGLDAVRLENGHWLLIYNNTVEGRNQLAVSLSEDEGRTWSHTRTIESQPKGQYHYPAAIQTRDRKVHVVYTYAPGSGKSMKHAVFNEAWVKAGEQ